MKLKSIFIPALIAFFLVLSAGIRSEAQTTISTAPSFTNNNGSGLVTFNFANTNNYPVTITDIATVIRQPGSSTFSLWYKTTPVNGPPGTVATSPDWTLVRNNVVNSTSGSGSANQPLEPVFTDLRFVIPANTTYGIAIGGFVTGGTAGTMGYYSIPGGSGVVTISGGGCNLITGTLIGYAAPNLTSNAQSTPVGFVGAITFGRIGANNAGVSKLNAPLNFCSGPRDIKVSIKNYGNNKINSAQIQWALDGVLQAPHNLITPLDTIGGAGISETEVTLGNYLFTSAPVTLKAWTALPNGVADTMNSNDTIAVVLKAALAGDYTINSGAATGGNNYRNFTDFTADLNKYGICGPVVANVTPGSGPYSERVKFGNIQGSGPLNTIRINGNGALIQYATSTTERPVLILSGTQYLTIDSLNFKTLSSDFGWGALITGASAYDSIINCHFDLSSVTNSGSVNGCGLTFSASDQFATTTGKNGTHCYIGRNRFRASTEAAGAHFGIAVAGASDSNIIEQNRIENFFNYSVYLSGTTGTQVLNNDINRAGKTTVATFTGIFITGVTPGTKVIGNRIHDPYGGGGTSTSAFNGIAASFGSSATEANPGIIANNAIYNINQGGTVYGINLGTSSHYRIYHNTVNIDKILTGTGVNYGIYLSGGNPGVEVKNNNVSITGGTGGVKYGFYYALSTSIADAQKNNFYVQSTQAGDQYYGYYQSPYLTQALFHAPSAFPFLEVGSPAVNPQFTNVATGNLTPANSVLFNAGTNLMSRVPFDINHNIRPPVPTPGAFQKPPSGQNNGGTLAVIKPAGSFCPDQQVSVSIMNDGTNDITSLQVFWQVNGVARPTISYNNTLSPITAGNNRFMDTIVLGNVNFASGVPTTLKVWTAMPNGSNDNQNYNDTLTVVMTSPAFRIASQDTICINSKSYMQLIPAAGYDNSSLGWQRSPNGNAPWTDIAATDTAAYVSGNLSADTWFRIRISGESSTCFSEAKKITVSDPKLNSFKDSSRCGPGSLVLDATTGGNSVAVWYQQPTGGTPVHIGNTFTTPVINANTTYYVAASKGAVQPAPTFIGTGTTSVNPLYGPYNRTFMGNKRQYLITAAELLNAGFLPGTITSIGFEVTTSGDALENFTLSMKATNMLSLPAALETGLTQVYSTPSYQPIPNKINKHVLQYPFFWNGADNLIIEACSNNSTGAGTGSNVKFTTLMSNNMSSYSFDNLATHCSNPVSLVFSINERPNIEVTMVEACETARQPVTAHIDPLPVINLGPDKNQCIDSGLLVVLDAGVQPGQSVFSWDDGSAKQVRAVDQSGTYSVVVTNEGGCKGYDTIQVTLRPYPVVHLGNDTVICEGAQLVLDAGDDGISYFWNTGLTTAAITVDRSGTYSVLVTGAAGCSKEDSIDVIVQGQLPSFSGILVDKKGSYTYTFSANNPQNVFGYEWDFGDGSPLSYQASPTHTYASENDYSVTLKVSSVCGIASDSTALKIVSIQGMEQEQERLLVYPNPTRDYTTILNKSNYKMTYITVYNIVGQKIYGQPADNGQSHILNMKGLASGVYTIHIATDKGTMVRKLEIIH